MFKDAAMLLAQRAQHAVIVYEELGTNTSSAVEYSPWVNLFLDLKELRIIAPPKPILPVWHIGVGLECVSFERYQMEQIIPRWHMFLH
jgi:hypothetical protein